MLRLIVPLVYLAYFQAYYYIIYYYISSESFEEYYIEYIDIRWYFKREKKEEKVNNKKVEGWKLYTNILIKRG